MNAAVRTMIVAGSLAIASGATATPASAPVCPVKPHHATHVRTHAHTAAAQHPTGGVGVAVDQARLISFPEPVKTLYIGNPVIADINMVDPQHAFVLGKTFGITNMIALSADGKQISNQQVTVLNNGAAVTINRGPEQYNYMCTLSHCETAPRPGDPQQYVGNTEGPATTHESTASQGAVSSGGQTASNQ